MSNPIKSRGAVAPKPPTMPAADAASMGITDLAAYVQRRFDKKPEWNGSSVKTHALETVYTATGQKLRVLVELSDREPVWVDVVGHEVDSDWDRSFTAKRLSGTSVAGVPQAQFVAARNRKSNQGRRSVR